MQIVHDPALVKSHYESIFSRLPGLNWPERMSGIIAVGQLAVYQTDAVVMGIVVPCP